MKSSSTDFVGLSDMGCSNMMVINALYFTTKKEEKRGGRLFGDAAADRKRKSVLGVKYLL